MLLRLSDEEVIVSTVTSDEKEFQHNRCVEEASIYDFPTNAISSLSPSKNFQTMISHFGSASRRPTHSALYSQSATLRMAEEEASNFYESEVSMICKICFFRIESFFSFYHGILKVYIGYSI